MNKRKRKFKIRNFSKILKLKAVELVKLLLIRNFVCVISRNVKFC